MIEMVVESNRRYAGDNRVRNRKDGAQMARSLRVDPPKSRDLKAELQTQIYGQDAVLDQIVPYLELQQARVVRPGMTLGNFFLVGPTGVGKTALVEATAHTLHGTKRHVLRINCGEFQMEHEVAKLIGAPPGYLGHRETAAALSQSKLNQITTEDCNASVILFDEIEKAAPSMTRVLLSILDKAELSLGDNSKVNFECSFVFFTSNLGTRRISEACERGLGFAPGDDLERLLETSTLRRYTREAMRKHFAPEFINRLDETCVFEPLQKETLRRIVLNRMDDVAERLRASWDLDDCSISLTEDAMQWFLTEGTSVRWGARELCRLVERTVVQVIARKLVPSPEELYVDYSVSLEDAKIVVEAVFGGN